MIGGSAEAIPCVSACLDHPMAPVRGKCDGGHMPDDHCGHGAEYHQFQNKSKFALLTVNNVYTDLPSAAFRLSDGTWVMPGVPVPDLGILRSASIAACRAMDRKPRAAPP